MNQNESTASPKDPKDIQSYTLLQFCNAHNSDIGKIREISHFKETNQQGEEVELDNLSGSVVIRVPHQRGNSCWPKYWTTALVGRLGSALIVAAKRKQHLGLI